MSFFCRQIFLSFHIGNLFSLPTFMWNNFTVTIERKTWNEPFLYNNKTLDCKLIDFWSWCNSDLLNNTLRGKLAEYIIAKALWIDNTFRVEWDEFDLIYNGLKIEIKSWAYIQSWEQEKYSNITFIIKPTKDFYSANLMRRSDIYVFAILSHKDALTINPLNLEHWEFYILETSVLNNMLWNQKTISLNTLLNLHPIKSNFEDLKNHIEQIRLWLIKD